VSEEVPWTVAEMEAALVSASVKGKLLVTTRAVLEELHRLGARRPEVEVRTASVLIEFGQNDQFSLSVDRSGTVRAWVWVEPVTYFTNGTVWRTRGRDVGAVLHEFALRVGLPQR